MPDVFVSYSRRDSVFVRGLVADLEARGKTVWLDTEGIEIGEVFPEAIRTAIEGSDAFLFVITPESAASSYCEQEVEHALALNKRVVPVLHKPVADDDLPEAIRVRNWIHYTADVDQPAAADRLIAALDTDLEHARAHTRWLIKALEWDAHGRDKSLLSRGSELSAAEAWLVGVKDDADPAVTPLQREYLLASRSASSRRQRLVVATSLVGLVAALALAGFALISRNQAQHSAATALGDSLGAQAIADPHLDKAMLLGVEGVQLDPSERTQNDLLTALLRAPTAIRVIQGDGIRVNGLAVSPEGRTLALEDNVPNIVFLDTATGRRVGEIPDSRLRGPPGEIVYTSDGKLVLLGGANPPDEVDLVDPKTATIVRRLPLPASVRAAIEPAGPSSPSPNFGGGLSLGDGGHRLAVDVADHVVQWSIPQGRPIGRPFAVPGGPGVVFYTPGARQLVVMGNERTFVVDARNGRIVRSYGFAGNPASLSSDGKTLIAGDNSGSVRFLDLATGAVAESSAAQVGGVQEVGFTPDGKTAITSGVDGTSRLWDVASHQVVRTLTGHADAVVGQAVSSDGSTLYTGGEDGTAIAWDLSGRRGFGPSFRAANSDPNIGAWNIAVSPDGSRVAVGASDGTVNLWDARSIRNVESFHTGPGFIAALSFGADEHTLLVARDALTKATRAHLEIWGLRPKPHLIRELQRGFPVYTWASLSPDGTTVAATAPVLHPVSGQGAKTPRDGLVAEWNAATGKALAPAMRIRGGGQATEVSFGSHGTTVAVNLLHDTVAMVDPARQKVLAQWKDSSSGYSWGAVLSPDGKRVATVDNDGYLQVWDAATGKPLLPAIRGSGGSLDSVAWSPDGSRLVTATDGAIQLYDAAGGQPIGAALPVSSGFSPYVMFSPDGRTIAATDTTGQVWLYPATTAGWRAAACRLANRNLTRAEWSKFVPGHAYRTLCGATGAH